MTIDALLADDSEDLQLHYNQMVNEAEQSVASLEDVLAGLSEIGDQVAADNAICKTQAVALESVCPGILPRFAAVNSFTQIPSTTNLKIALEEIDKKKAGIIAAIVIAAGAFLYKLWKWISGKSDSTADTTAKVGTQAEIVAKAEEALKDATHDLTQKGVDVHAIEGEVRKVEQVQTKLQLVSEHYSVVVHQCFTGNVFDALSKSVGALTNSGMILDQMEKMLHDFTVEFANLRKSREAEQITQEQFVEQLKLKMDHQGPVLMTDLYNYGFRGLELIKTYLESSGLVANASTLKELRADVSSDIVGIQIAKLEDAKHLKEWLSNFAQQLRTQQNTNHSVNGYVEVEKVLSNVRMFVTRSAALRNNSDKLNQLSGIEERFTESKVAARAKAAHDNDLLSVTFKNAEHMLTVYSQCTALVVQIINAVLGDCLRFLGAAATYQNTRKKTMVEKSKEWIKQKWEPGNPKIQAAEDVFKMLLDDTIAE